jgi:hypothetical protein
MESSRSPDAAFEAEAGEVEKLLSAVRRLYEDLGSSLRIQDMGSRQ